jgi:phage shock protein A
MANVVRKMYRYLSAAANKKLDEKADPRIQLEQAIDEARRQHHAFVQQAAAVVGNQRQLEMRMARQIDDVNNLTESARQSLILADDARASGDVATAQRYEQTAQAFASQLVSAEGSLEDMKGLHAQAVQAATQARAAVEDNTTRLEQMMTERARLLTQIEHAAMQEQMSKSLEAMSPLALPGDTPTLGQVRDKVERQHALALGRQELASQGMQARMLEVRRATHDARAANRLAQLRGSMAGELAGEREGSDADGELRPGQQPGPSLTKGDTPGPAAGSGSV